MGLALRRVVDTFRRHRFRPIGELQGTRQMRSRLALILGAIVFAAVIAAGMTYAVDADIGAWRWRAKTNYPSQSGMTPTAGGVVFFGDMGGDFYALDTTNGRKL